MSYQEAIGKWKNFFNILQAHGVGLAYFLGSQKDLGPRLLDGEELSGDRSRAGKVIANHPAIAIW